MSDSTPAAAAPTALFRLVEQRLMALPPSKRPDVTGLADYITQARVDNRAYHTIARELTNLTGETLTHEAVRRWHRSITGADHDNGQG